MWLPMNPIGQLLSSRTVGADQVDDRGGEPSLFSGPGEVVRSERLTRIRKVSGSDQQKPRHAELIAGESRRGEARRDATLVFDGHDFAYFNNDGYGHAVANARRLRILTNS
jgi:hypothetical protein